MRSEAKVSSTMSPGVWIVIPVVRAVRRSFESKKVLSKRAA